MECRLDRVVDFGTHDVFVGEIVATHAEEAVLTAEGGIDLAEVKPMLFDMASKSYWSLGGPLGSCWSVGKGMKRRLSGKDEPA
jgi:flavin reductase (DIM6/NTAB) family NADH-FMN oxidoreductase RutF